MLRQVAYDTLSRRDRKARHLAVAAHLRIAFAGDGEEVTDVIARHYLDALHAIPDDPDTAEIRGQAIAALIRAGERAERTGAPARAAASYAAAAELSPPDTAAGLAIGPARRAAVGTRGRGRHCRRRTLPRQSSMPAGPAVITCGTASPGQRPAPRQSPGGHCACGAVTPKPAISSPRRCRCCGQIPTPTRCAPWGSLQRLEVFAGSPDADRLTGEALILGQALDVGTGQLAQLFTIRGIYLGMVERRPEAIAYFRESARLATQVGDNFGLGRALLNLAEALAPTDPAAAVEAARTAAGHLRRPGVRDYLATAIGNLAQALMGLGDWDAAEAELTQAVDSDGLADIDRLACERGQLAALRGDAGTAETMLAGLRDMRASEDPQDKSMIDIVEAFLAAARRQPQDALRHAQAILAHADALGISAHTTRWAWPLAARAAHELGDAAGARELLALLDSYQPGHLAPMLRAERDLVRARLAASDDAHAAAITSLRERSTPYHLAHGLLDYAQHLLRQGDADAAEPVTDEARDIGRRLRCQPLLDRAGDMTPAEPRART